MRAFATLAVAAAVTACGKHGSDERVAVPVAASSLSDSNKTAAGFGIPTTAVLHQAVLAEDIHSAALDIMREGKSSRPAPSAIPFASALQMLRADSLRQSIHRLVDHEPTKRAYLEGLHHIINSPNAKSCDSNCKSDDSPSGWGNDRGYFRVVDGPCETFTLSTGSYIACSLLATVEDLNAKELEIKNEPVPHADRSAMSFEFVLNAATKNLTMLWQDRLYFSGDVDVEAAALAFVLNAPVIKLKGAVLPVPDSVRGAVIYSLDQKFDSWRTWEQEHPPLNAWHRIDLGGRACIPTSPRAAIRELQRDALSFQQANKKGSSGQIEEVEISLAASGKVYKFVRGRELCEAALRVAANAQGQLQ